MGYVKSEDLRSSTSSSRHEVKKKEQGQRSYAMSKRIGDKSEKKKSMMKKQKGDTLVRYFFQSLAFYWRRATQGNLIFSLALIYFLARRAGRSLRASAANSTKKSGAASRDLLSIVTGGIRSGLALVGMPNSLSSLSLDLCGLALLWRLLSCTKIILAFLRLPNRDKFDRVGGVVWSMLKVRRCN